MYRQFRVLAFWHLWFISDNCSSLVLGKKRMSCSPYSKCLLFNIKPDFKNVNGEISKHFVFSADILITADTLQSINLQVIFTEINKVENWFSRAGN